MKRIDLHIHTTASDGSFTPSEVVEEAKRQGLSTIAITDHDTVAGVADAIERGRELGIEVIAGIELTTYYKDKRIDILGYQIDFNNQQLLEVIDNLQNSREFRARQILNKLSDLGIDLDFDRLKEISGDTGVGRPHIARLMVEEGYVQGMQEAFDNYLEDGGPAYVPKYQLKPEDAIKLIKDAEGLVVLAHPGIIADNEIVKKLIACNGIDGIEVYYSKHTEEETNYYLSLAQKNNLIVTGGSDCHGPANENKYLLGTVEVPYELLEKLR
jgi:hypothetical protein